MVISTQLSWHCMDGQSVSSYTMRGKAVKLGGVNQSLKLILLEKGGLFYVGSIPATTSLSLDFLTGHSQVFITMLSLVKGKLVIKHLKIYKIVLKLKYFP